MPRLAHALVRRAHQVHACLVPLLRVCRDLPSALNELRWLQEHVNRISVSSRLASGTALSPFDPDYRDDWRKHTLNRLCASRGRGVPLQYLLGTEYFGSLELKVRSGVLIPRRETAAAISHLASVLIANERHVTLHFDNHRPDAQRRLKIVDLCTGSGCIPLLLRHTLAGIGTESLGVDVSLHAVKLATENEKKTRHTTRVSTCKFVEGDVFVDMAHDGRMPELERILENSGMNDIDVLVSNPPYVSPIEYTSQTERSVRNYEPRLALVPSKRTARPSLIFTSKERQLSKLEQDEQQGDAFYPRLLHIAGLIRPKIFWCEVGGLEQAKRVAAMALEDGISWDGVQIWRDEPAGKAVEYVVINGKRVGIVGHGHGRSVICWRDEGAAWLGI